MKQIVVLATLGFLFARPTTGLTELIYWTDRFDGTISVGDTSTNSISTIVSNPSFTPWGIALDQSSSSIFFTNGTNSGDSNASVYSVGLNGSGLTSLTTSSSATRQIVLNSAAGKMYWASETAGGIYEANLDGSNKHLIETGLYNPRALAIDLTTGKLFFDTLLPNETSRTIMSANLDGSNAHSVVTGQDTTIWGMTVDPITHQIYWGTAFGGDILRANADGTGLQTVVSGLGFSVLSIQIDSINGRLYAAGDSTWGGGPGGGIISANLDGSNVTSLFSGVDATNISISASSVTPPPVQPVPEPTSLVLLGLGGIGLAFRAYGRRKASST